MTSNKSTDPSHRGSLLVSCYLALHSQHRFRGRLKRASSLLIARVFDAVPACFNASCLGVLFDTTRVWFGLQGHTARGTTPTGPTILNRRRVFCSLACTSTCMCTTPLVATGIMPFWLLVSGGVIFNSRCLTQAWRTNVYFRRFQCKRQWSPSLKSMVLTLRWLDTCTRTSAPIEHCTTKRCQSGPTQVCTEGLMQVLSCPFHTRACTDRLVASGSCVSPSGTSMQHH